MEAAGYQMNDFQYLIGSLVGNDFVRSSVNGKPIIGCGRCQGDGLSLPSEWLVMVLPRILAQRKPHSLRHAYFCFYL